MVEDGQSVSQGKLDQLSRYGEREAGVFSLLAPGVFRRLAPMTQEAVQATLITGGVGVVETALGPSVLSFCSLWAKEYDENDDDDDSLNQTLGMSDPSSQVFLEHPVHGLNAPYNLDRSKAVRAEPVGHADEQAQQQDHSQEGEGGWRDGSRWIVRCEQR